VETVKAGARSASGPTRRATADLRPNPSAGRMRAARARLAMALLGAAALLPALGLALQLGGSGWQTAADELGAFDRRLTPLRAALRGEARVGYLPPGGSLGARGGAAHFSLTRYALAPVLVVVGAEPGLVVADGVVDRARVPPELEVARDFGGGLLLLRRRR
jgi:hypothetical protein